jgi:hypothetical protein
LERATAEPPFSNSKFAAYLSAFTCMASRRHHMEKKKDICDFINCRGDATQNNFFVNAWFRTGGKPWSICKINKTECGFFKKLVEGGGLDER